MKKLKAIIAAAGIAACVASAAVPVYAQPETNPLYIFDVGDKIEPLVETGNVTQGCGYEFEIVGRETDENDIWYTLKLLGSEYDIQLRISDGDLWDIGCYVIESGK